MKFKSKLITTCVLINLITPMIILYVQMRINDNYHQVSGDFNEKLSKSHEKLTTGGRNRKNTVKISKVDKFTKRPIVYKKKITYSNIIKSIDDQIDEKRNELMIDSGKKRDYRWQKRNFTHIINLNDQKKWKLLKNMEIIEIKANFENLVNAMNQIYYDFTSNNCSLYNTITTLQKDNPRTGKRIRCITTNNKTTVERTLMTLRDVYPIGNKDQIVLDSLFIVKNGLLGSEGQVYYDNIKFTPFTCNSKTKMNIPNNLDKIPYFQQVFSIHHVQNQGNDSFRTTIESLARLAPYSNWLRKNPTIKIHMMKPKYENQLNELISMLKLKKDQFIFHPFVKAKISYLPKGIGCASTLPHFHFQLLASKIKASQNITERSDRRKKGFLIDYSFKTNLESIIIKEARKRRFTIYLSTRKTSRILSKAIKTMEKIDVAVLTKAPTTFENFVWTNKGTLIIELICRNTSNKDISNFYGQLAQVLSMKYHAVVVDGECKKNSQYFLSKIREVL